MSAGLRIVAVVPAKDAAASIADTVAGLAGVAGVTHVLVVDDGSTDATAKKARAAGAWVLGLPEN
ncbi:MAG TPA: glycosyltransferase, partial [Acidimicrobiales bacterium]|nr:glycosyltransferase [Acidimicrobiales bacterium]